MGFHIRFDKKSSQLVQLVTKNPSQAFGRVYSAYVLFLLGERDQSELNWLLDSAMALDSLTDEEIAYCVFAKEFNVTLKTRRDPSFEVTSHHRKSLGKYPFEEFPDEWAVSRLVKNGKFGRVMDGDEITAVTYGTDMVARELGLIGQLPCIVVIDALPSSTAFVLTLDAETTPKLLSILRSAIAEFRASGGSAASHAIGTRLVELQEEAQQESLRDTRLRAETAALSEKISKLEVLITKPQKPEHLAQMENALESYRRRNTDLTAELNELSRTHQQRNSENELRLQKLRKEFEHDETRSFSRILDRHVRKNGLERKLRAAKATSMSYLGNLFKPDFLLKILAALS